ARFGKIRLEKRAHYAKKVAEIANSLYIDLTTNKPNVKGLILAGSAGFKTVLAGHESFDARLQNIVLQTLDISYGQEEGLKQAIKLAQGCLTDCKFVQEQRLLNTYMDEIRQDTGCFCFGVRDTLNCLEMGAVQLLIVFEDLSSLRVVTRNPQGLEDVHVVEPDQLHTVPKKDKETDQDLEIISNELLVEYLALNYKSFGTTIEFVSDKSAEGSQFCSGFGGIGGILRYPIDMAALDPMDSSEMDDLDDFI
ncbi:peptide chain release factor eRF1/aRF1, partial [Kipferlia bialata]